MYIQSYISKGQHVFGNYQINLSKKGEVIPQERANQLEISEVVAAQDSEGKNHYTFIIGENGSGKTSFLKSLVIGLLSKYTNYNWTEFKQGGLGYLKYFSKPFTTWTNYNKSTIGFNAIIYFANHCFLSSERGLENMYFENHMGQNGSKVPLLRMLSSYNEHLNKLNQYLRHRDCSWRVEIEYFPQPHYKYNDGGEIIEMLPHLQSNFLAFQQLITNESLVGNPNLGEEYGKFLYNVVNNRYFPLHVDPRNPKQHFIAISESKIYKKLLEVAPDFLEGSSNKRIYDDRECSAYHIEHDVLSSLSEQDLWILPLLTEIGLVRYEIFMDDIPLNELSSGEQILIQLFCNLAPICSKVKKKDSYLFSYDEPETSLHPKWQQQFPLLFQQVVDDIFGITDSHFIFCTHSPLIIMKAVELPNSSVLKFTYDEGKFKSEKITDINKYCVEELLLDEFGISYFSKEQVNSMEKAIKHMSPTETIVNTEELKTKIDNLYQEVMRQ